MKVSIITASFNSAVTINGTLSCIANQSYQNIEHIIIDGGSIDATLDIVNSYPHISKVVSEKDRGIYDAINKGIYISTGEIIAILNSDDIYSNDTVIEDVVELMHKMNTDSLYSNLNYVNGDNINIIERRWVSGFYQKNKFLRGWMPPHPTFFVKKEVYSRYGVFRLDMGSAADYEIMLRFLYKHDVSTTWMNKVIVKMRTGGVSNASFVDRLKANRLDKRAWEVNDLEPNWYTILAKPLSKVGQWMKFG